jgi:hypothetical protein
MTDADRDEPKRYITKIEGVRHVLHSAIRCQLGGENPFAIHILAQSVERVLVDILKAENIPDPFYSLIKPERKAEFFAAYREPSTSSNTLTKIMMVCCPSMTSSAHPILLCWEQSFV